MFTRPVRPAADHPRTAITTWLLPVVEGVDGSLLTREAPEYALHH